MTSPRPTCRATRTPNGILEQGETWIYTSTSAAAPGLLHNIARVQGVDDYTVPYTDDDSAYLFGIVVKVDIQKAINAVNPWAPTGIEDADVVGRGLIAGMHPIWTYLVTNQGNVAIAAAAVVVRDDNGTPGTTADDFTPKFVGGDLNANGMLDVGEVWLFTSEGVIVYTVGTAGVTNIGTVTITDPPSGGRATASDAAVFRVVAGQGNGHTPGFWKNNAVNWDSGAWPRNPDGTSSTARTRPSAASSPPPPVDMARRRFWRRSATAAVGPMPCSGRPSRRCFRPRTCSSPTR